MRLGVGTVCGKIWARAEEPWKPACKVARGGQAAQMWWQETEPLHVPVHLRGAVIPIHPHLQAVHRGALTPTWLGVGLSHYLHPPVPLVGLCGAAVVPAKHAAPHEGQLRLPGEEGKAR